MNEFKKMSQKKSAGERVNAGRDVVINNILDEDGEKRKKEKKKKKEKSKGKKREREEKGNEGVRIVYIPVPAESGFSSIPLSYSHRLPKRREMMRGYASSFNPMMLSPFSSFKPKFKSSAFDLASFLRRNALSVPASSSVEAPLSHPLPLPMNRDEIKVKLNPTKEQDKAIDEFFHEHPLHDDGKDEEGVEDEPVSFPIAHPSSPPLEPVVDPIEEEEPNDEASPPERDVIEEAEEEQADDDEPPPLPDDEPPSLPDDDDDDEPPPLPERDDEPPPLPERDDEAEEEDVVIPISQWRVMSKIEELKQHLSRGEFPPESMPSRIKMLLNQYADGFTPTLVEALTKVLAEGNVLTDEVQDVIKRFSEGEREDKEADEDEAPPERDVVLPLSQLRVLSKIGELKEHLSRGELPLDSLPSGIKMFLNLNADGFTPALVKALTKVLADENALTEEVRDVIKRFSEGEREDFILNEEEEEEENEEESEEEVVSAKEDILLMDRLITKNGLPPGFDIDVYVHNFLEQKDLSASDIGLLIIVLKKHKLLSKPLNAFLLKQQEQKRREEDSDDDW